MSHVNRHVTPAGALRARAQHAELAVARERSVVARLPGSLDELEALVTSPRMGRFTGAEREVVLAHLERRRAARAGGDVAAVGSVAADAITRRLGGG